MAARRFVLAAVLSVVALLALEALLAAVRLEKNALRSWARAEMAPALQDALGREVSFGDVAVKTFPGPGLRLENLRVAGSGSRPLFTVQVLEVGFRAWPLLRSGGKEMRIDRVALQRPEVNLVLLPGGQWDHTAAVEQLFRDSVEPAIALDELTVRDGLVRRIDTASPGRSTAVLSGLDIDASRPSGGPLSVSLQASLGDGPKNLSASLQARPGVRTLELSDIDLKGPGLDLAGSALLSIDGPRMTFDLSGPLLDLDALRGVFPREGAPPAGSPSATGLQAAGSLSVQRLVAHARVTEHVVVRASAGAGTLHFEKGTGMLQGGAVDLSGTTLELPGTD